MCATEQIERNDAEGRKIFYNHETKRFDELLERYI